MSSTRDAAFVSRSVLTVACATAVAIGASGPVMAETQAEKFARLVSDDLARQSARALSVGERAAAIDLTLQGILSEPAAEDLETYSRAYRSLLTAAVSRSLRLPLRLHGSSRLDPTGRRAVTISGQDTRKDY